MWQIKRFSLLLFPCIFSFQAPPKEVPKTIENQRIYDETTVNPEDEEVNCDPYSTYYLLLLTSFTILKVTCGILLNPGGF